MEGKLYYLTLGLLVLQAFASLFMGLSSPVFFVELFFVALFIVASVYFILYAFINSQKAFLMGAFAFCFGFLNIVFLVFHVISLWLVIMLCLNAVGFFLVLDSLGRFKPVSTSSVLKSNSKSGSNSKSIKSDSLAQVKVYDIKSSKSVNKPKSSKKNSSSKKRISVKKKSVKKDVSSKKVSSGSRNSSISKSTKKSVRNKSNSNSYKKNVSKKK